MNVSIKSKLDPLSVDLPKWSALVVSGKDVSLRDAAEILIRTDRHFPDFRYSGNNRNLRRDLNAIFEIPSRDSDHVQKSIFNLRKRLKVLDLSYLANDQIMSSWIGGPHGWINWSGQVGTSNYNIGKYPSVSSVLSEWKAIASAFKFLDLTAWLYDKESGEEGGKPVVRFEVKGGSAEVFCQEDTGTDLPNASTKIDMTRVLSRLFSPSGESGISPSDLATKVLEIYGKIPKIRVTKERTR